MLHPARPLPAAGRRARRRAEPLGIWVSAVCLEPAWKMRSVLILLLAVLLYLLYLSSVPESYNGFFPWLALYVLGGQTLIFHSIARFKEGRQD